MEQKELCIRCNKPTPYHPETPITLRRYYVEGSGQLCPHCWQELYGVAGSLESMSGAGLGEQNTTEPPKQTGSELKCLKNNQSTSTTKPSW